MITLHDITKAYGSQNSGVPVLKGVSLQIENGAFAAVLGPSGSGKSTLLNVISGLERPDSGRVLYDDTDIAKLPDTQLTAFRKQKVGFIFQQYYLLEHLTVKQNVKMGADLANNKEYETIIAAVGLEDKLHKFPNELSGGEQQRVSVARALAKRPEVLFLDEPTGALDEETGRMLLDYVCKLQKEYGFTMVMVTHNNNIAEMASVVLKMNSGRLTECYNNAAQKNAYQIGW